MNPTRLLATLLLSVFSLQPSAFSASAEVIVYGGTPGGVAAATAAARMGKSVILADMNNHIGGMIAGGLTYGDLGERQTVGGLADEFFRRNVEYYTRTYGENSREVERCDKGLRLEPSIAEKIFMEMLTEAKVTVWKNHRFKSVERAPDGNILSITTDDLRNGGTQTFRGKIFVDATYEGDFIAAAGVPTHYGREGRDVYNESIAGIGVGPERGQPDKLIQSYNYRVTITNKPGNTIPFHKPETYDPVADKDYYKGYIRTINSRKLDDFHGLLVSGPERAGPNEKYDINWFDFAGSSTGYTEGTWEEREAIALKMRNRAQGLLYFLQNDKRLRPEFLEGMKRWGYPKDEYTDNNHFSFQLYVREARRMIGDYVMTEHDVTQNPYKPDAVCIGSYGIDCHMINFIKVDGVRVMDATAHYLTAPYGIPYRSLVPQNKPGQPKNLLVPVCLSASHVAFCSIRMEPVFMMLGHAAGIAAHLAIEKNTPVQNVDVGQLQKILREQKAVLDTNFRPQFAIKVTPLNPKPGQQVTFSIEEIELRAPAKRIAWDFTGNGTVDANGAKVTTTFTTEKIHTVSAFLEDETLRRTLRTIEVPVGQAAVRDITIDEVDAEKGPAGWRAGWRGHLPRANGRDTDVWLGVGSRHAEPSTKRTAFARYEPTIEKDGLYEVCLAYRPAKKQADNTPVLIHHADGTTKIALDQKTETNTPFYFHPIGKFRFKKGQPAVIELSNEAANGRVVIDGLRLIPLAE